LANHRQIDKAGPGDGVNDLHAGMRASLARGEQLPQLVISGINLQALFAVRVDCAAVHRFPIERRRHEWLRSLKWLGARTLLSI